MYTHMEKPKEGRNRAVVNKVTQCKNKSKKQLQILNCSKDRESNNVLGNSLKPIQRAIKFKDVTYDNASDITGIIAIMKSDKVTTGSGKVLSRWLTDGKQHGPYATSEELKTALEVRSQVGRDAQTLGKDREMMVATKIEGEVSAFGKYGQDEVVYLDPNGDRNNHRHVKLDVKTTTTYGIVGGAQKADNLEKFEQICNDLKVISEAHGKTPKVYCAANTPQAVIDIATRVVGPLNVVMIQ